MRFLFTLMCLAAAPILQAKLDFEQTRITYDAPLGAKSMQAEFKFTNDGSEELEIRSIVSKCDCTVAELEKKIYKPGESGVISAEFTFGDREGQHKKTILVGTNVNVAPIELDMIAEIKPLLAIQPRLLKWRKDETAAAQELQLTYAKDAYEIVFEPEHLSNFKIEYKSSKDGVHLYQITPLETDKSVRQDLVLGVRPLEEEAPQTEFLAQKKLFLMVR